jgi:hypothetical protein
VSITGEGVATYPAFAASTRRYGVTTTQVTGGTVTVTAATSDPDGRVLVNGRQVRRDSVRVTGLVEGDEVSVILVDSAGRSAYSFVYLPAGFPALQRMSPEAGGGPDPGLVMVTLGLWTQESAFYEAALDSNGVPAYVRSTTSSMDLKKQPNGNYSVARNTGDSRGAEIVELDSQFREVARHRTQGLHHTDGHDSLLLPDGSRYLMAYEPNDSTGVTDAVVQHISAAGAVLFEWNSQDHVDIAAETVEEGSPDYAHINSIDVMDDGDLLLSFRHLSSVFKVARTAHDGFEVGDVVWRLGGRASDFAFVDTLGQPDGGPCAQHTATELPGGDIMVFDNGAGSFNPLCADPADPSGPPVARVPSRIAVWNLDETTGMATMVKDHRVESRYAIFAGSAQPLPSGNTLVGWASSTAAVVSELDESGDIVWELRDVENPKYFSYRAFKTDVPDEIAPEVHVTAPSEGATYELGADVRPRFACTDRGGSNLTSCRAGSVDTSSVGTRSFEVTARDGAGNTTAVRQSYTVVLPGSRPDAMIRRAGTRRFTGRHQYAVRPRQLVEGVIRRDRGRQTALVRVRNEGSQADRYVARSTVSSRAMAVRLLLPDGLRTSPRLAPGEAWTFRVRVARRARTRDGQSVLVRLDLASKREGGGEDVVWFRARAR